MSMEQRWNDNDMGKLKYSKKNCDSGTLSTKNPIRTDMESNPGLLEDRQPNNRLNQRMAQLRHHNT